MPWSQTTPMDQKTQFIADYLRETFSFTELCARYGVSRETGYKLVERYLEQGPAGTRGAIATTAHQSESDRRAHRRGVARASSSSPALGREEADPAARRSVIRAGTCLVARRCSTS